MAGSESQGILKFVRLYPDHFIGGVVGMSACEVGVYFRLLLAYYTGDGVPLPADEARMRRIAAIQGKSECRALEHVLGQKFRLTDEGYRHDRADRELERARAAYAREVAASERGRRAARARHEQADPDEVDRRLRENC